MDDKQALIKELVAETAATADLTGRETLSPRLLAALSKVRREAFVPPSEAQLAYLNTPLPIGHGQTISQPFIVAIMTELLDLEPDDVVLEIGSGSGYQAAILAELARRVFGVELVLELADGARRALAEEGYQNVEIRCGDGNEGWPEHAPYDAIIVTAGAERVPPALLAQLKPRGRMIIPVGQYYATQRLVLIEKDEAGEIEQRDVMSVAFVPLVGGKKQR
jgi:protein-L-isoaspartate(D-aspartate) O-methyltransferase